MFKILCRKTEEALKSRRFRIRPTLCVFGCTARLQPGPVKAHKARTLTSLDHYAEGMGKLRGRRSGRMQARTTHNQTTERSFMITQRQLRAGLAGFACEGCIANGVPRVNRSRMPCYRVYARCVPSAPACGPWSPAQPST